jgi:hypothetical protein
MITSWSGERLSRRAQCIAALQMGGDGLGIIACNAIYFVNFSDIDFLYSMREELKCASVNFVALKYLKMPASVGLVGG